MHLPFQNPGSAPGDNHNDDDDTDVDDTDDQDAFDGDGEQNDDYPVTAAALPWVHGNVNESLKSKVLGMTL